MSSLTTKTNKQMSKTTVRTKAKDPAKKKVWVHKRVKNMLLFGVSIILSLSIVLLAIMIKVKIVKMPGYSMMPTIMQGDYLVVSKVDKVKRFDLVYIRTPNRGNEVSIRRVIGLPDDELAYENDLLTINGNGLSERYLNDRKMSMQGSLLTEDFTLKGVTGQTKVPRHAYFVLGDNRQGAADSRYYGFVSDQDVIGRVVLGILPIHQL